MERHLKNSAIFSIVFGIFAFLVVSFFVKLQWALLYGVLFAFALMLVLPVILSADDRKYKDIRADIPEEILLSLNANVWMDGKARNNRLFLTKDILYLFSRDRKPWTELKIEKGDVLAIKIKEPIYLYLMLSEGKSLEIQYAGYRQVAAAMSEAGWGDPIVIPWEKRH